MRVTAPRSCPGHGGASTADIIITIETRKNRDANRVMAARSWCPQTPGREAGHTLFTPGVYAQIFENTRLTLVMRDLLAISIIDSAAGPALNHNGRTLPMRWNGCLITISIAAALVSAAMPSRAATFGTVVPIAGPASDIALDESRGVLYIANFT